MDTFTQSEIFFFISSVGFVILWILVSIFLVYLIYLMYRFSKIIQKIDKDIDEIGDTAKELADELRENKVFKFIFGGKPHKHKHTNKV